MGKKVKDAAVPPSCYKDHVFFRVDEVCQECPFYVPCGIALGQIEEMRPRKELEDHLAWHRIPFREAVNTIVKLYGCTVNAAELSYGRRLKKVRAF
jgi:hypothetical protein